jgi:hypothetical protein
LAVKGRQHIQFEELNMLQFVTKILISAAFCLAALAPAKAVPRMLQNLSPQVSQSAGLVDVHYKRRGYHRHYNRHYYNGHRGFRHHRRGYRHYNGYWYPPAAFSFGIIIGRQHYGHSYGIRPGFTNRQHLRYCYNRYRSYRHYDNSFQPYHGPRKQCRSPFY